jgi:uncharacterized protein (TIGR02270 family)
MSQPNPADHPPIEPVIRQHAEDAVVLHNVRMAQVRAPHIKLHHLGRLDERLAAHLDGLAVAGESGSRLCDMALENPGASELFVATVLALENGDATRLERLLALAEALPETQGGLSSAFGWVSAGVLQGTVRGLLSSPTPFHRWVGLTWSTPSTTRIRDCAPGRCAPWASSAGGSPSLRRAPPCTTEASPAASGAPGRR